jgi:hypothetical protein
MKRNYWVLAAILIASLPGVGAAVDPTAGQLVITLSTSTPTVSYGTRTGFKIELFNHTDHNENCSRWWLNGVNTLYPFEIVDASGKQMPLRKMGAGISSGGKCTLAPGESTYWWQGLEPSTYPTLGPGKYTVRVSWQDPDNPHSERQYSNPIVFTILPAPQPAEAAAQEAKPALQLILSPGHEQSSVSAPARILIAAGSPIIFAGDPVYVSAQLENTSDHSIKTTVAFMGGVDLRYTFHLTAQDGAVLGDAAKPKPFLGSIGVLTMQPGQKEDLSYCLSCRYHGLLTVGKYRAYAIRLVEDGTAVKSNEITITVVPKQPATPPVTLTISGPETITVGEKANISAVLRNVSSHTIGIMWGETYTIQIHNESGKEPPPKPGLWGTGGGSGSTVDIEPGKTFTELVAGLGVYDLSAPGKYFVRVKRPLHIVNNPPGSTESSILESNEITITVVSQAAGRACRSFCSGA